MTFGSVKTEGNLFGHSLVTIENICQIAKNLDPVHLSDDPQFVASIEAGKKFIETLLKQDGQVYGVTTGFGDSCTTTVPAELAKDLAKQLVQFHQCGLGEFLTNEQVRAVLATRLTSLSRAKSGVSYGLLKQITALLNHNILPRIPSEGSVGASGDLTPLSYVAAALIGEGEVVYQNEICLAKDALRNAQISAIEFAPKEGLAVMNGTAVMTALACLAYKRAEYLCRLSSRITSLLSLAMKGNAFHFDELLFAAKPFPGQGAVAGWIRSDLKNSESPRNSARLQDRYSLRCAPHVIGVLQDALPFFRQIIETELNSTNDNPIIDAENERVLHGGHFYGGHIAFVMDAMKNAVANIADLLDRQLAQLVDPKFNNGLPANLTGANGPKRLISHGFKAVQIGASAWTAEALKLTMPASVFSRSTESHNQDKVSMGTIAARDCLRILQLTEQVAAGTLLAAAQGVELRRQQNELSVEDISSAHLEFLKDVDTDFEFVTNDRPLDKTLRLFVQNIQNEKWELYL